MKDFCFKKISAMEKVFAAKEPSGEASPEVLTALKGETVSFQIAFQWTGQMPARGKVEVVSPIGDQVEVRAVELVPCEYPCHMERDADYLATEPGLYPDLLAPIPELGVRMAAGHWSSLWVDIVVEKDTEAGKYPVEVKLIVNGEEAGAVQVVCEVLDAELPKLSIPHTEWFHTDCLANYYGVEVFSEKYWEIVENFVRSAVKMKCNMLLTPVFTPPLDTAIGGERRTVQLIDVKVEGSAYTFGFEKFERWVDMCKRCGIEYIEIAHLFSQWGAVAAPKIMGEKDGEMVQLFGWDTDASGEAYGDFLHQFLTALKEELTKLEINDKAFFHVSDEPQMAQIDSYRAARNVVAEDLKGYAMFDALSDYDFYKEGLVSVPVCALDHIEPFIKNRPEKLWGYYCTGQWKDVSNRYIVQPGYRTRILGVQMYKYQLDGFLQWGFNFYNSYHSLYPIDPFRCTDSSGAFPAGDPFIVYPGPDGKPMESIRYMLMQEAMSDLCAMNYLESLAGRETVMKCIESSPAEEVTFDKYPRNITYMTACRERINAEIKKALKA